MTNPLIRLAMERAETEPVRQVSDDDLVRTILGAEPGASAPLAALSRASAAEIAEMLDVSPTRAARLASAFELGRRGAWSPPARGDRCLDPGRVHEVMRDVAHQDAEDFHVVLLDVRGRLLGRRLSSRGSISQCPVSPRDVFRAVVREGAYGAPTFAPKDLVAAAHRRRLRPWYSTLRKAGSERLHSKEYEGEQGRCLCRRLSGASPQ